MLHAHLASGLHYLAGAADAHPAGLGDMQAELGRSGMHGFSGVDANALAGAGELDLMLVGDRHRRRVGGFGGQFLDLLADIRRRRAKGFLMVATHVIAVALEQALDCVHVGGRAAAEDFPFHEIRGDQLEHALIQVAAVT
ncbi:hypothetical protein D9M68_874300 [compost metagenome]